MFSKVFIHNRQTHNYPLNQKIKVTITSENGKLNGIFGVGSNDPSAPTMLLLHPDPNNGGTMYNEAIQYVFSLAMSMGFIVLTINFSKTTNPKNNTGINEFEDAVDAFKWLSKQRPYSKSRWVFGFSFGAYIASQLTMRRPEIDHFIFLSMPVGVHDISFFSPCPTQGLFIHSQVDKIIPENFLLDFFIKNDKCKNISYHRLEDGSNHFMKNVDYSKSILPGIHQYIKTHCIWPDLKLNPEYDSIGKDLNFLHYDDFESNIENISEEIHQEENELEEMLV
jgi:alpha/beta superfamily hydrolase